jgi:hypothetical protein
MDIHHEASTQTSNQKNSQKKVGKKEKMYKNIPVWTPSAAMKFSVMVR